MKIKLHLFAALNLVAMVMISHTVYATGQANRDAVRSTYGGVIKTTSGDCVYTRWQTGKGGCGGMESRGIMQRKLPPSGIAVPQQSDADHTIYFDFGKTTFSENERKKLDVLADILKSNHDKVRGVSIVGYTDRLGEAVLNDKLSKQRMQVVERYLKQHGNLGDKIIRKGWAGASNISKTQCPDSMNHQALVECLQKDRRVTVEIEFKANRQRQLPGKNMPAAE